MEKDAVYMREAIKQAGKAKEVHEVPIGAVIVYRDEIIATGYNVREISQKTLSHAELFAIEEANRKIGSWRLEDCTLYVTLEPCPMCAGALVQSRIKRVVFGAPDPKAGCASTLMNLLQYERFNHQADVTGGVLEAECSAMLTAFFRELRQKKS
ncbi:tRNA adenosine(34) deaminase TadA [Lentibacillus sp.]|uniref:tRNA adenosine(34) deaminase TadA n=1 Tax=Lentibacillus sp. TaxID=1925746 RepID=UPI002B4B4A10|nr:tRNA adenosine(34) deaminase TadA [Lentibacillus sp.]HLS08956.1 tRNA adenosine(34) deaminase TadA [Lentibacillus sp.]